MFLNYRGTNVHALGYVTMKAVVLRNKRTGKTRTIQRLATQAPQDIHWLRPGWNEFPKRIWDQNKDHPEILMMLKKRKIILMKEEFTVPVRDKGGRKKLVKRLMGQDDAKFVLRFVPTERAIQIVKETYNRDILRRWLDEDNRTKVKSALRKQIKPLLKSAKDTEEDDDSTFDDDDIEDLGSFEK